MPSPDSLLEPTPPDQLVATSAPVKLCLLIVFNHRFDKNLPKLDWLYRSRFRHIRYLVPFYRGDRTDVIPVHYSSYQYQGFFRQAWDRLRGEGFTHFVVVADDMLLNPVLNDENLISELEVQPGQGYFGIIEPFSERGLSWFAAGSSLVAVAGTNGMHWEPDLPAAEAARANLEAKGYPVGGRLGWHNFRTGGTPRVKGFFQFLFYLMLRARKRRSTPETRLLDLPYPLLSGNADFMVIPAEHMEKFCHYCSVFAAMGVFVEVGAPTALALACSHVVQAKNIDWIARDYCVGFRTHAEADAFYTAHDYDLEKLMGGFGAKDLMLHPIKISRWKYPGPDAPPFPRQASASREAAAY